MPAYGSRLLSSFAAFAERSEISRKKRIHVIDSNHKIIAGLFKPFEKMDYEVVFSTHSEFSLQNITEASIIILELMPYDSEDFRYEGEKILEQIWAARLTIPIIILTTLNLQERFVEELLEYQNVRVVAQKPISPTALRDCIVRYTT